VENIPADFAVLGVFGEWLFDVEGAFRMKSSVQLSLIAALIIATPASAEPKDRWWSGWGMGISEYGWSGSDGTSIYITCDGENNMGLNVAIRGTDPKPKSNVIFKVNGQEIVFWTEANGNVEMQSRASTNNLTFLFDELRSGRSVTLQFDGLSKTIPLKGSGKGLGKGLCK
jgi:hypothetical protein